MVKVINDDAEFYTWESRPGNLKVGTFMDNEVTFEQFMFAMNVDDPLQVKKVHEACLKMKNEFERELNEPVGIIIYAVTKDEGVEFTIGTSFSDS